MDKNQKETKIFLLVFLLFFGIFSMAKSSEAANWYVDNTATGSNNGTSWVDAWQSFSSIKWETGGVAAGDTIYISGGSTTKTYTENITFGGSGTDGNPITLKIGQDGGHNGVATFTNSGPFGGIFITKSYITIDGNYAGNQHIRVTGCGTNGIEVYGTAHHVILAYLEVDNNGDESGEHGVYANLADSSYYPRVELSYSKIHDNWQDGISVGGTLASSQRYGNVLIHHNEIYNTADDGVESNCPGVDIYNNTVHDLVSSKGAGHPDGLVIMGSYGRIYNNVVYNFSHDTVLTNSYLYLNPYTSTANTNYCCARIYNNLAYQTDPVRSGNYVRGIEASWQTGGSGSWNEINDVIIANNTIVGMPWSALSFFPRVASGKLTNIFIKNNLFHNNARYNAGTTAFLFGGTGNWTIGTSGSDVIFDYNIVSAGDDGTTLSSWNGGAATSYLDFKTAHAVDGNIINETNNPNLTAPYKLQASSTNAVDTGTSMATYFAYDLENNTRSGAWDIGAYEYVSSDVVAPTAPSGLSVS